MVTRLGGEDKFAAKTVEARDSPPQKLTKLEEINLNVENAVMKCYNRTDVRDKQRSRIFKAKYIPWMELVQPTEP